METGWEMPNNGSIKINIHAITYNNPLPNDNNSGIGVVLRDENDEIILMVSDTIKDLTPRANELWAMLVALRSDFYENEQKVILETESVEAVKDWEDWRWFVALNHIRVIQQLEKRKEENKLKLKVKVIQESQNHLVRYLAEDGAMNRTRFVVFRRPFGRVTELWHLDMGLVDDHFDLIEEDEYNQARQLEIQDEMEGVADWLVQGDGSDNV